MRQLRLLAIAAARESRSTAGTAGEMLDVAGCSLQCWATENCVSRCLIWGLGAAEGFQRRPALAAAALKVSGSLDFPSLLPPLFPFRAMNSLPSLYVCMFLSQAPAQVLR